MPIGWIVIGALGSFLWIPFSKINILKKNSILKYIIPEWFFISYFFPIMTLYLILQFIKPRLITNEFVYFGIFDWIDHDPHKRAPYITEHAKPELKKENSLARELLVKYGKEESVQKSLARNFSTGGFSGPGSMYYQKRKDEILVYKETDDNENVRNWIDFYVKALDEDIKREKLHEEREFN